MTPLKWSLRALLMSVLVLAASLAALRRPTDQVALAAGITLTIVLLAAVAVMFGSTGARRSACAAFVVVGTLTLYLNESDRQLLSYLPRYSDALAAWLNERYRWAEWKGPPKTWVYWSSGGVVQHVSFDADGNLRSTGAMPLDQAERRLGGTIDVSTLPDECPLPRPSYSALRSIVTLTVALISGWLAGLLAYTVGKQAT